MAKDKCELKNGWYNWCNGMKKSLEGEANAKRKGFIQVNLFNFKKGTESCLGVAYKKSMHDKGIMLNYCPFCSQIILNTPKLKDKNTRKELEERKKE